MNVPPGWRPRQAMQPMSQAQLERWITAPRFKAYLDAASGNRRDAMALYDWDVCVSAVFFEVLSYAEVLLRNAIDAQFQPVNHGMAASASWLHDASILKPRSLERVDEAEKQLEREGKTPTRAGVVAGLSFGFWRALFNRRGASPTRTSRRLRRSSGGRHSRTSPHQYASDRPFPPASLGDAGMARFATDRDDRKDGVDNEARLYDPSSVSDVTMTG